MHSRNRLNNLNLLTLSYQLLPIVHEHEQQYELASSFKRTYEKLVKCINTSSCSSKNRPTALPEQQQNQNLHIFFEACGRCKHYEAHTLSSALMSSNKTVVFGDSQKLKRCTAAYILYAHYTLFFVVFSQQKMNVTKQWWKLRQKFQPSEAKYMWFWLWVVMLE